MAKNNTVVIRGLIEVKGLFNRENKVLNKQGKKFLFGMGNFTKKVAKEKIEAVGSVFTGELKDGIHFKTTARNNSITTVVAPSAKADKYAVFVERGTKPHRAPIDALRPWAEFHGIPVGAVWHSIATKGTRPRHFWRDTIAEVEPEFDKRLTIFVAGILEE